MNYNTRSLLHGRKHGGAVRIIQSRPHVAPRTAGPTVYLNDASAKRGALQKQYRETEAALAKARAWKKTGHDNDIEIVLLRGRLRGIAQRLNECD